MNGISLQAREEQVVIYYTKFIEKITKYNVNIVECIDCKGTGLCEIVLYEDNKKISYSWSGFYCRTCRGAGKYIVDLKIKEGELYVCPMCSSVFDPINKKWNDLNQKYISNYLPQHKYVDCQFCNDEGVVDWVRYLRGI